MRLPELQRSPFVSWDSEEVWGSSQLFSIQLCFEAADGRWIYQQNQQQNDV